MRSGVTPDQETIAARLKAADLALEIVKRLRDHPPEVQKLALRQAVGILGLRAEPVEEPVQPLKDREDQRAQRICDPGQRPDDPADQ